MLRLDDTIAGVATAPGLGGVAVLRLSGGRAREIASRLVRPWPAPRRAALRTLRAPDGAPLDEALVLWMPGPGSFTGEDTVELHTHGGAVAPRRVLAALLGAGARLAEPGEFSRRAVLSGRLSLEAAEALNDLVHAEDEAFAEQALRQVQGGLRRRIEGLRKQLVSLAARVEVVLDFPEEDVPALDTGDVPERLGRIDAALARLAASYDRGRLLRHGVRVALVGRPNVGKSSLLNALLGEERAIVTAEPGTTRDVLEEGFTFQGVRYRLQDTAGLRETSSVAEREGIERARAVAREAELRVLVTEAPRPLAPEERAWLEDVDPATTVVARNKRDLGPAAALPPGLPAELGVVETVAPEAEGLEELMEALAARAGGEAGRGEDVVLTNLRHRDAVARARSSLERFRQAVASGVPPDVSLTELYAATDHLAGILGPVGSEDVLDVVFRDFCLGK